MATFRIFEDQENRVSGVLKKENANVQRKALGILNHDTINSQRGLKTTLGVIENIKSQGENKFACANVKNTKSGIQPPVAQFEAFSVYEEEERSEGDDVCKEPSKRDSLKQQAGKKHGLSERLPLPEKSKDASLDASMSSVLDMSVCPMSVSRSENEADLTEDGQKATARTPKEQFFHVAEYREDIYNYMRTIELKHRAHPHYMRKQPDISHGMRAILVDWLVEVGEEYHLHAETLHLGVSYVDRFLSFMSVVRVKLQLVGTAAMFIAAKYEEIYPPDVGEFVYITDDTYNKKQVLRMEHLILKVLSFDLSTPTPLAFISHLCISNGLSQKTLSLATYLCELTLLEADPYLCYLSSVIGAAAVATARHCLLCGRCSPQKREDEDEKPFAECLDLAWPESLQLTSGYSLSLPELKACLKDLCMTHFNASKQPHQAIPEKYKTSKYEGVALFDAKPMFKVVEGEKADGAVLSLEREQLNNAKNDESSKESSS